MADDVTVAVGGAAGAPRPKSLKSKVIEGVLWTLAADGGAQIIRFISTTVLTRLLLPEMFGVMVVVQIVQQGLAMFSDVGIQPAIVQHKRGDDRAFLDTAWTIQSGRGMILWLVSCGLAWPVSIYAKEPILITLLPIVGLGSLVDGFVSTKVFTCDRHLSRGRLTFLNLGTAVLGLIARIVWAVLSPTVWALVFGGLVGSVSRVVLSHFILAGPINRFRWERSEVKELMQFGRWVFISTILSFIATQLDKLVFVRMVPMSLLGVYNIGLSVCRLPTESVQRIGTNVTFPAFSRLREREGNLGSAYTRVRAPLLAGGGAIISALTLGGPLVAQILFPAKYSDAGWIMQIVALGMWFQALESTNGSILLASGLPKWLVIGNVVKIAAMAAALPLSYHYWGFPGALVAMSLVEFPKYVVEAARVRRMGLAGWGIELGLTAAVLVCAGAALGLHFWNPGGSPGLKLAPAAGCGLAVWGPLLLWAGRTARMEA